MTRGHFVSLRFQWAAEFCDYRLKAICDTGVASAAINRAKYSSLNSECKSCYHFVYYKV